MSANAIETLREWAEHDYGDWMLTSKGAERLAEIGDALAAVEALLEAAKIVWVRHGHVHWCSSQDEEHRGPCDCGASELAAAVRRMETGQ